MMRNAAFAAVLAALTVLAACGSSPATATAPSYRVDPARLNTESPIAGETLACAGDYPDSRLVFLPDGRLDGRFARSDVSGWWSAVAPGRVEVEIRAEGITIRETMRRTATGWQGDATRCG